MSEAIRVEHLNYAYPGVDNTPGVAVFTDLNLTIEHGSFVAILGSNGCGKSTLAKHSIPFCCLAAVKFGFAVWILLTMIC